MSVMEYYMNISIDRGRMVYSFCLPESSGGGCSGKTASESSKILLRDLIEYGGEKGVVVKITTGMPNFGLLSGDALSKDDFDAVWKYLSNNSSHRIIPSYSQCIKDKILFEF